MFASIANLLILSIMQDVSSLILLKSKNRYSNLAPSNSVLTPTAQFTTLCDNRITQFVELIESSVIASNKFNLSEYERALIELQFLFGLRVSEVLSIKHSDIDSAGFIRVQGLKGSNNRTVVSVSFKQYWLRVRSLQIELSYLANRFYYYRLLKRIGCYHYVSTQVTDKVTHLFRYAVVYRMLKSGASLIDVQQFLGHRSIESTQHYLNNLQHV